MIFCRFCGTAIAEDSVFCAKCGRRLGRPSHPRLEKIVSTLRLRTPYPYFGILILLFAVWSVRPRQAPVDYSRLKWSIQLDQKLDSPEENQYLQALSLVVENMGPVAVHDIPVDLSAHIEPQKPAEVTASFPGRQLLIMQSGRSNPLGIDLADPVAPGTKRRYLWEANIQAVSPFKITYEVRERDADVLLASYVVQR